jgi:uncharacterized protein (TIGR02996 family)
MTEEDGFLRSIAQRPEDDTNRLVFADWLEERGDWRAGFLRLACALRGVAGEKEHYSAIETCWRELQQALDHTWGASVMSPPDGPEAAQGGQEYSGPVRPDAIMNWAGL